MSYANFKLLTLTLTLGIEERARHEKRKLREKKFPFCIYFLLKHKAGHRNGSHVVRVIKDGCIITIGSTKAIH